MVAARQATASLTDSEYVKNPHADKNSHSIDTLGQYEPPRLVQPEPTNEPAQPGNVPDIQLPPELIRAYVANIQPMLLTRCGASNCHGHATVSEFQLHRVPNRRPTRSMTMRNLAATLEQLDKSNPVESPLFTWGQNPHGQTQSKLLSISNAHQQTMLVNWIQGVTSPPTPPDRSKSEAIADRQRVFADGAERISLRRIKEHGIRWQEPTRQAEPRWQQSSEPAHRESTQIEFAPQR